MSGSRFTQIGLDRLVRLAWLKQTSSLVLAGNTSEDIKTILQNDLSDAFRSTRKDVRGSLDKTITTLMKIWCNVPNSLFPLQNDGMKLISTLPTEYHIAVHWGMVMAVYPFWGAVATNVGRLLKLQGSVVASQVQRRLCEQYGERETVSRRVRYVLRSYVDWGVISETGTKGIYTQERTVRIDDPKLISWLIEASLHSQSNGSASLHGAIESLSLFPFHLKPISADNLIAVSSRLESLRHGLDEDIVMLRR